MALSQILHHLAAIVISYMWEIQMAMSEATVILTVDFAHEAQTTSECHHI